MYNHIKSKAHIAWLEELSSTRWYANYGRTLLSPRLESIVFAKFNTDACMKPLAQERVV